MNTLAILIAVVFGALGALGVAALYKNLDRRISKLEEAQQKRVNVRSLEEYENAMVEIAVMDTQEDLEHEIKKARINTIRTHLSKAHTPTKK